MRLRKQMAALALACAAAGGSAPRALGQYAPAPAAQPSAAPDAAPRPLEVTVETEKPAPTPSEKPAPAGATVTVDPSGPFALTQIRAEPAPQDPARDAQQERQRTIELYRAQFGGQLTKAPYLGVSTSSVPAALRQHLALPEGVGLVVDFVEPDSPAKAAGLKQYDILTKLNDQILVNAQQLAVLVRAHKAGEEVKLTLIRGGKETSASAKLVEKEVKQLGEIGFDGFPAPVDFNLATNREQERALIDRMRSRRTRNDNNNANKEPPRPEQPDKGGGDKPGPDQNARAGNDERVMMVWRDNDMALTMTRRPGDEGRHLVVTDKSGKTLFDGNIDNDKERSRLPREVAEKVRQMESKLWKGDKPDAPAEQRGAADPSPAGEGEFRLGTTLELKVDPAGGVDDPNVRPDDGPSSRARIGNNDVLNIALRDVPGAGVRTLKTARVRDGRVTLPFVAPVKCEGLTEAELEKKITLTYAEAKVAPNVTVRVRKVAHADGKDVDKQDAEAAALARP